MPKSPAVEAVGPSAKIPSVPSSIPILSSNQGILVFTSSLQLCFMNHPAVKLVGQINEIQKGVMASGVIPSEIISMCSEILGVLLSGSDAKSWEDFQVQKMIGTPQHPILLRGFGLPASEGIQQSHVLILIEETSPHQQFTLENFQEQFHLTVRELAVVETLCKGLTNKEIAVELGIAEQTVKEHVKNVMVKTQASTRTGILALALSFTKDSIKGGRFPSPNSYDKEAQAGQSRECRENQDREHQKAQPNGSLAKVSSAA